MNESWSRSEVLKRQGCRHWRESPEMSVNGMDPTKRQGAVVPLPTAYIHTSEAWSFVNVDSASAHMAQGRSWVASVEESERQKDKQQTCMGASRERKCIFAHPSLLYFTRIMGKYECGSCGASSTRSGRQRLNAKGGVGGNLDSEYALRAEVMVAIA